MTGSLWSSILKHSAAPLPSPLRARFGVGRLRRAARRLRRLDGDPCSTHGVLRGQRLSDARGGLTPDELSASPHPGGGGPLLCRVRAGRLGPVNIERRVCGLARGGFEPGSGRPSGSSTSPRFVARSRSCTGHSRTEAPPALGPARLSHYSRRVSTRAQVRDFRRAHVRAHDGCRGS